MDIREIGWECVDWIWLRQVTVAEFYSNGNVPVGSTSKAEN
jgi:hypothetical protein